MTWDVSECTGQEGCYDKQTMSINHDSCDRIQCYYRLEECPVMLVHEEQAHSDVRVLSSSDSLLN